MEADFSNCKDPENRSRKLCVCGGHNGNNPKRNLNHNATDARQTIRKIRILKRDMDDYLLVFDGYKNLGIWENKIK